MRCVREMFQVWKGKAFKNRMLQRGLAGFTLLDLELELELDYET